MKRSGVYAHKDQGLLGGGGGYLRANSNSLKNSGKTDFTSSATFHVTKGESNVPGLQRRTLYIAPTKSGKLYGHNTNNFGNYLWGNAAKIVGLNLIQAKSAAQVNNFLNDLNTKGQADSKTTNFQLN